MTPKQERTEQLRQLIIMQPLEGLLYDLDLMPEQIRNQADRDRGEAITVLKDEIQRLSASPAGEAVRLAVEVLELVCRASMSSTHPGKQEKMLGKQAIIMQPVLSIPSLATP